MKKAKIMLVAITVLGIAGGALAVKAQNFGAVTFLANTCDASDHLCDVTSTTVHNYTTADVSPITETFAAAKIGTTCASSTDCQKVVTLYFAN